MRTIKVLALTLFAISLSGSPANGQSRDSTVVRSQLLEIEREIARANNECDYRYFDHIEADEFVFTDATGGLTTKKEDLAGEKSCRKNATAQTFDEVIVQPHGSWAVLSARTTMSFVDREGHSGTRQNRFTDVFIWRDGRWQLVAGHSSRIPPAPPTT
jgi:ketosteroid isomerase-like protein